MSLLIPLQSIHIMMIRRYFITLILIFLISIQGNGQQYYDIIIHCDEHVTPEILLEKLNTNNTYETDLNHQIQKLSRSMNIWKLKINSNKSRLEFMSGLRKIPGIIAAQYDQKVLRRGEIIPSDVYFNQQWNIRNVGQIGGKIGADCKASFAWSLPWKKTTAFGDTIVVAVIDDMYDTTITEIDWFRNKWDVPNNGIDDDANGYIDDHYGWNTISDDGNIQVSSISNYHGSHVSGIIGAKGNNDTGVAGIHWGVKILPIVGANVGNVSDIIQAYNYVIEQKKMYLQSGGTKGAFIVATNSSFGLDNEFPTDQPIWCAMYDSMGKYGILSAAATTNALSDVDIMGDIPSTCASEFLIVVTSSNFEDQHTTRGYGKIAVDISAPGEGIFSSDPGKIFSAKSGTSFASPHLAGAVSLLFSLTNSTFINKYTTDMPTNILKIKEAIMSGVDTISALGIRNKSSGRLNLYKSGLKAMALNASVTLSNTTEQEELKIQINESNILIEVPMNYSKVTICDLTGRSILQQKLYSDIQNRISKENFPPGLYLFTFEGEHNSKITKKIVF